MFKCQNCGKQVEKHQPENKIVIEFRVKEYANEVKQWRKTETIYTKGHEIVKEIRTCPNCYRSWTGKEPKLYVPKSEHKSQRNLPDKRQFETRKKQPIVEIVNPLPLIK